MVSCLSFYHFWFNYYQKRAKNTINPTYAQQDTVFLDKLQSIGVVQNYQSRDNARDPTAKGK